MVVPVDVPCRDVARVEGGWKIHYYNRYMVLPG